MRFSLKPILTAAVVITISASAQAGTPLLTATCALSGPGVALCAGLGTVMHEGVKVLNGKEAFGDSGEGMKVVNGVGDVLAKTFGYGGDQKVIPLTKEQMAADRDDRSSRYSR